MNKASIILFCISFLCIGMLQGKYVYELAICAIFRNEARFMREWIEFHKLVGVEHFYLYNNGSTDHYKEVLQPYIRAGDVDLYAWHKENRKDQPWRSIQCAAYNDCLTRTRGTLKWLAFIDLDEYLFPTEQLSLKDFLRDYKEFAGVCVNWLMFGTSNVFRISHNDLRMRKLVMRAQNPWASGKVIVRPKRIERMISAHYAQCKDGFFQVIETKARRDRGTLFGDPVNKIRVNHYWSGDYTNFLYNKIISLLHRGSLTTAQVAALIMEEKEKYNAEKDCSIHKYLHAMERATR